jgi:uncharacterized membrane protein
MGAFHPQVVHFAVALLVVGVGFRLVSLLGRPAWIGPAAAALLLGGTLATFAAVKSGDDAHGPVERIPGVRSVVVEHEEWAHQTRNVFGAVALLELIALALRKSPKAKLAHAAVAVVGLFGVYSLYRTGEHGGELVYAYAGGPGIRSGDPQDVGRLLLAGLYHQAQLDRKAGKAAEAAQLIDEAARRFGSSPEVQLLQIESRLVDRKDAAGALQALTALQVPAGSAPLQTRAAMLKADALLADGRRDDAIATLQQLSQQFPASTRIKQRLEQLTRPGGQ